MAAALIALYRKAGDGRWVHKKELPMLGGASGCGDFAKLSYWDLIEEKAKNDLDDKKNSGWWRITDKGRLFVENKHLITEYVLIYDSRVVGFDGDQIRITDTLGDKFSYTELMEK
jgi:hypothetical protein